GTAKAKDVLQALAAQAWRDGKAGTEAPLKGGRLPVSVERVGSVGDLLLWRIARKQPDLLATLVKRVSGLEGELFANSGVLAAAVDDEGRVLAANAAFVERLGGERAAGVRLHFGGLHEHRDNSIR